MGGKEVVNGCANFLNVTSNQLASLLCTELWFPQMITSTNTLRTQISSFKLQVFHCEHLVKYTVLMSVESPSNTLKCVG